jgi:uncharacterized protein (DUF736 family)
MTTIGTFTATRGGGWEGRIRTLTINVRAKIIPNDNRENAKAPDYLVMVGQVELGAAWVHLSREPSSIEYLSVHIDDPSLPEPISAAMFPAREGEEAQLVWSRRRPG